VIYSSTSIVEVESMGMRPLLSITTGFQDPATGTTSQVIDVGSTT